MMATTWPQKRRGNSRKRQGKYLKNNRYTKYDALAARRVLRDAYRARNDLVKAASETNVATWRLRWITTITILRAVGHVLKSIDEHRSSEMKQAIQSAWNRWDREALHNQIFHSFIKRERDIVLKEYRFDTAAVLPADTVEEFVEAGPQVPLKIGDQMYRPVQAVDAAIAWWEKEIDNIELDAGCPLNKPE